MLSMQQQNNMINNNPHLASVNPMMPSMAMPSTGQATQQENQHDRSSVNSQQGLADKIQAVRHLWESENQYNNSSTFAHQIPPYNSQATSSMVDSTIYNHMNNTFQPTATAAATTTPGFIQFQ